MDLEDPSRRELLQALAATSLSSSFLAASGSRTASAASGVTMNDLSYQLDYDIDRFSGQNVSNSGGVRYEEKKFAADSSFFTWQSGTWVNAGDSSRDSNLAGNIYAPGAKDSRVIIEKDTTETDLVFATSYVYTDDQNDDNFPQAAWVEYAFDVAWKAIDDATPFFVPPRPPSVEEDSNETGKDTSPSGATFTYYDPSPPTAEEEYTVTHSADWRWDASGAVDPGWNYTSANRKVDVGEWLWDVDAGWTFGSEQLHQLALSTAFCIYQEDETVCETSCSQCVQPSLQTVDTQSTDTQSDDSLTRTLRECCTLDAVSKPIPVTKPHLETAKTNARDLDHIPGKNPVSRFEVQAARSLDEAPEMDGRFRRLVAYRSAAAHARGAGVRQGAIAGVINAQNAAERSNQVANETRALHNKLRYTGDSLDAVVGEIGQLEKTLLSARTWAESAGDAFDVDHLGDDEQLKYAEAGIAFAEGNLDDAEHYLDATDTARSGAPDQAGALGALYDALADRVHDDLGSSRSSTDTHVEYALRETRSYLDRAEDRHGDGLLAAAVVDLVYATGYLRAAEDLEAADFGSVDTAKLKVEQELVADRFNQHADAVSGAIERHLLRMASLEYNSGVESFGTSQAMSDHTEAERAYRHYVTTDALLDTATAIYDTYRLD